MQEESHTGGAARSRSGRHSVGKSHTATLREMPQTAQACKPFNIEYVTRYSPNSSRSAFSRCSSLFVSPCISSCTTRGTNCSHLRMTTRWHLLEGKNNLNLTCTMPGSTSSAGVFATREFPQEMQACMHGHTSFQRCTSQYAFDDRPGIGLAADASVQHDTVYSRQSQGESSCWLQPQHD